MALLLTIVLFVVVLSVLVFVHEWGHFWTARKMGVRVDEFGLGFPPRLFGKQKGETMYSLNLIPLGGFVRLFGESGEGKGEPGSFASASKKAKALILVAGVTMNALTAVVLFGVSSVIGSRALVPEAGFDASARVRDQATEIVYVLPESPAATAGLMPGDRLVAVNGSTGGSAEAWRAEFQTSVGEPKELMIRSLEGETRTIAVTPGTLQLGDGKTAQGIGVQLVDTAHVSYPVWLAPWEGVKRTWLTSTAIVSSFADLAVRAFHREPVAEVLSGPVGIAAYTGQAAQRGLGTLLEFAALLSLNLAILNLFPIPALDGGRLLFLAIEALRRKPMSERLEQMLHQGAFLVLISLILFITYQDIVRLIRT